MKVLFRYDDYSELGDIKTDISVFNTILDNGFNLMVGIIPKIAAIDWEIGNSIPLKKLSSERINLLNEFPANKLEIALHGYTHQTITRYSGLCEFSDSISLNQQIERIKDGKKILEDSFSKPIKWFIPPWNAYGKITIEALKRCEITGFSADASAGLIADGLNYIPITCQLINLNQAISCSKKDSESHIVVMLHSYDFKNNKWGNNGITTSEFETILKKLKTLQIEGSTFDFLAANNNCNASRAILNQNIHQQMKTPLRLISHRGTANIYWGIKAGKKVLKQLSTKKHLVDNVRSLSHFFSK